MKKICLIFGGNSPEHLISCKSTKEIYKNIDRKKYDVTLTAISKDNIWYEYIDNVEKIENWMENSKKTKIENIPLYLKNFDIVFPIVHGVNGEDGKLHALFELFNINYVGSSPLTNALCLDKGFTKILCEYHNIQQIDFLVIKKTQKISLEEIIKKISFPLIIKPAHGGSSIGITTAQNKKELQTSIKEAFKYDDKIIIEKFIKSIDIECGYLECAKEKFSPLGEIIPNNQFYDYDSKYVNETKTRLPANIDKDAETKIYSIASKIIDIFEIKGFARIDFLYDKKGKKVYFNEINTIPGFTKISMYSKLWMHKGLTYKELITKIIDKK